MLDQLQLQKIGPFRGLGRVARELDIPLTLFGGVASRVALRLIRRPRMRLNLFDLAPFSADIDLEYAAGPERGPEVLAAIQEYVPFASWFRWSLVDEVRAVEAAAQRQISTTVPLRSIRFTTNASPDISADAFNDLRTGRVSFQRNPKFNRGSSPQAHRDVELFGLMMALNAEVDVMNVDRSAPGIDEETALRWLETDGWNDLIEILNDERLLGRFWILFVTRWGLAGPNGKVFETLTNMAHKIGILSRLGFAPNDSTMPLGLSKLSRSGHFRASQLTPEIYTGPEAKGPFIGVMNDIIGAMGQIRRITTPEELIDPALELVAVAPFITIERLSDDDEMTDPLDIFQSGLADEFLQLSWQYKGTKLGRGGFTAQLFPYGQRYSATSASSVPAVGGVHDGGQAWIRIRLDDLIGVEDKKEKITAALVVLKARHD